MRVAIRAAVGIAAGLYIAGGLFTGIWASASATAHHLDGLELRVIQALLPASPSIAQAKYDDPASVLPDNLTVLFMGIDRRPDEEAWATRTDTMMVVSLDPRTRNAAALSIPRDLVVSIPLAKGRPIEDRINTANLYGDLYNHPGGGAALAVQTVSNTFGLPVDHYVYVDMDAFRRMIDSIGGIDVDVPEKVVDPQYPTDYYGTMRISIDPGPQHFDGERALQYARSRHQDSDFGRMRRQQLVIRAVMERARRPEVLFRLPELLGQVQELVRTDLTPAQLLALAWVGKDIRPEAVRAAVLDYGFVNYTTGYGGASLLLPLRDRIRLLVRQVFYGEDHTAELARIEVVNPSSRPAIATELANRVKAEGFQIVLPVQTASFRTTVPATTTVLARPGWEETASRVAQTLQLPADRLKTDTTEPTFYADVRVLIGEDMLQN